MNIMTDTFSFRNNQFSDGSITNAVHDLFTLDETNKFQSKSIPQSVPVTTPVQSKASFVADPYTNQSMNDSIRELHDAYSYNINRMMDDYNKKITNYSYEKYVNMFMLFILFILIIYIHSKMNYMHKLMKYTMIHQKGFSDGPPSFPM
jgi:hypothetical protein